MYAEAHGLVAFEFYVADWFGELLAAQGIRQWEYVKIFMMQDAMYKHAGRADWVVWVDSDVFVISVVSVDLVMSDVSIDLGDSVDLGDSRLGRFG